MNNETIEHLLARRKPAELPPEWREQILSAAAENQVSRREMNIISALFGWRGLAAAWALIAILHFGSGSGPQVFQSSAKGGATLGDLHEWTEQRRALAQGLEPEPKPQAAPEIKRPRSSRRGGGKSESIVS